jgi:transcriptional regulator with XRE-family HTH domain
MPEDTETLRARARSLARTHEHFKASLVEMRRRHGLTQPQVAELLGISQAAISKFESYDSNPTLASVRRYALAIGATLRLEVIDGLGETGQDRAGATTGTWVVTEPTVAQASAISSEPVRRGEDARWHTVGVTVRR